jgi:NitT/TauT family transport system substrate-binding protein
MVRVQSMTAKSPAQRILVLLAALALIVGLAGAAYWRPISAWWAPPSAPEELTLAVNTAYTMSGLVHLAAANEYFAAEGLKVTLQPHNSGLSALDAVIANQAEIATVADTPVMFAVTRKVPLAIVATIASATHSHGIVARRDRGVSAAADLKGKAIGVPLGTDAHFLLNVILAGHGIAPDEVRVSNVKPENMVAALSTGQIDAIAIWDPWLSQAGKAAGASSVMIYPEKGFKLDFNLVGRRDFVRNRPAAMQKLLRALLRSERFLEAQPQAARAIIVAATNSDPASFDAVWPNFNLRLTLSQSLLTILEDQARWAISSGLTEAKDVPNFLESIYLDAMLAVKPQAVSIVR